MSAFFFFNDTATTEIYTLSLHDALPIFAGGGAAACPRCGVTMTQRPIGGGSFGPGYAPRREWLICPKCHRSAIFEDRKSTRLNSSHANISYAVFCLKKKKRYTDSILIIE